MELPSSKPASLCSIKGTKLASANGAPGSRAQQRKTLRETQTHPDEFHQNSDQTQISVAQSATQTQRPARLPIFPTPIMPIQWAAPLPVNQPMVPAGMRPPLLPTPIMAPPADDVVGQSHDLI
ncbi:hypothetical protein CCACVL1_28947 [Corchorus capsularis]|uniref:Uncharacterized protein n=1 Tax=Corchorus capsularis TaxID=210143 RepID=A0A1R3G4I7_COCAP|nr:hypothetical protein CCACVL1_28947 [Corchorus capsularis]